MNNYMQGTQQTANLQKTNGIQTGISQPPKLAPKKVINLFGQEYILCKDATDSTTAFPHNRVKIQNGDCVPIKENNIDVFFCYIHGTIQPLPNSLEKPVEVYYVGFHKNFVDMRFITPADVARMHVYKCDTVDWATNFARNILGVTQESEEQRDPISPFPEELLQQTTNDNLNDQFKTSDIPKKNKNINTNNDAGVLTTNNNTDGE